MIIMHLSDLHVGKWVNGYQMLEDQKYIFKQILETASNEKPDAVIIAGDIYDKSVPSAQAVECFDEFLSGLSMIVPIVFIISGNHDSPERLNFGSRLMDKSGVIIKSIYEGHTEPFITEDEYGPLYIYLLPFIKPAMIKRFHEELSDETLSYNDAVRIAVNEMNIDESRRNVIAAHQFITGSSRSDSEEVSVGGIDNIDASVFEKFDYTALGHIHRPQNTGSEKIRYCGSPLKYSFSECRYEKSVTLVHLKEKGNVKVYTVPLVPLHDMKEIKGRYDEITLKSFYENTTLQEDYVHITLTDEEDVLNAAARLQTIYHNLMKLDYDNHRTRSAAQITEMEDMEERSPMELFSQFYKTQNALEMSEEQKDFVKDLIEKIWEDKE